MSTSFTRTREQLAAMVLRKFGALGAGETANSDDLTVVYEAIDLRLKEMHRLGVLWWKVSGATSDLSLTASTATVAAPADLLFPISLAIRDGDDDLPVTLIDHRAYQAIQTKTDAGTPTQAFYDSVTRNFYLYETPDSAYTAKLTYQKMADDTAASTAPDVPVSHLRWLKDLIAYDIGDDFSIEEDRMVRFEREAEKAERRIRALTAPRTDPQPVEMTSF